MEWILNQMYREQNFMLNRDVDAYGEKQRLSCLWLDHELRSWKVMTLDARLDCLLEYLLGVHKRQEGYFPGKGGEPGPSFYFDTMYRIAGRGDYIRLAIHSVSYARGFIRYQEMVAEGCGYPWDMLVNDADSNLEFCVATLESIAGERGAESMLSAVIRLEGQVMKNVDARNAMK